MLAAERLRASGKPPGALAVEQTSRASFALGFVAAVGMGWCALAQP